MDSGDVLLQLVQDKPEPEPISIQNLSKISKISKISERSILLNVHFWILEEEALPWGVEEVLQTSSSEACPSPFLVPHPFLRRLVPFRGQQLVCLERLTLRGGQLVNRVHYIVTANQSIVIGLMGRSDWTRAFDQ